MQIEEIRAVTNFQVKVALFNYAERTQTPIDEVLDSVNWEVKTEDEGSCVFGKFVILRVDYKNGRGLLFKQVNFYNNKNEHINIWVVS